MPLKCFQLTVGIAFGGGDCGGGDGTVGDRVIAIVHSGIIKGGAGESSSTSLEEVSL